MTLLQRLANPFRRCWQAYSGALDTHPLRTKAATALIIFTTADTIRQRIEARLAAGSNGGGSAPFVWDAERTLRLSGFYAAVHAPWVHHWYAALDRVLGRSAGWQVVAAKVCADQLLSMPLFMTVLLSSQTLLAGHDLAYCRAKLQRDLLPTIQGAWMCWIPALVVAFTFVPLKYRLLYANCVQVVFGVWISKQANAPLHPAPSPETSLPMLGGNATRLPLSPPQRDDES